MVIMIKKYNRMLSINFSQLVNKFWYLLQGRTGRDGERGAMGDQGDKVRYIRQMAKGSELVLLHATK